LIPLSPTIPKKWFNFEEIAVQPLHQRVTENQRSARGEGCQRRNLIPLMSEGLAEIAEGEGVEEDAEAEDEHEEDEDLIF
jgi:hypothetical protein